MTTYRLKNETVMEEQQVTTLRPEWIEEIHKHRFMVAEPVTETSAREERFMVRKSVYQTEFAMKRMTGRRT